MVRPSRSLLLCAVALAGCRAEQPANEPAPAAAPANNVAEAPPPIVTPPPRLDREALLLAALRARSAAATGADDRAAQAELDGRTFSVSIRLGCTLGQETGAAGGDAGLRASWDPDERQVRIAATPNLTKEDPLAAAIAGETFEAVEGFWIADPWLLVPHCAGAGPAAPIAAPVGLAQFFTPADPRTARRDERPYEARVTLPEGSTPASGSWDLVLNGRLRPVADGKVIACRPPVPGAPPVCIVSVRFDQVQIRDVQTGAQLAEWRGG